MKRLEGMPISSGYANGLAVVYVNLQALVECRKQIILPLVPSAGHLLAHTQSQSVTELLQIPRIPPLTRQFCQNEVLADDGGIAKNSEIGICVGVSLSAIRVSHRVPLANRHCVLRS